MRETPIERVERALRDKEITLEQFHTAMDEAEREVEKEERPMNIVFWVLLGVAIAYFAIHIVVAYMRHH